MMDDNQSKVANSSLLSCIASVDTSSDSRLHRLSWTVRDVYDEFLTSDESAGSFYPLG
jgi:hypothetical protein